MLTLLPVPLGECDKFITLKSKRNKFITLTTMHKLTVGSDLQRRPGDLPGGCLYVQMLRSLYVQASKCLSIYTSRRPNAQKSVCPGVCLLYVCTSRCLYVYTFRRLYSQVSKCRDVYTPGCLSVETSIRLDVQMLRHFSSRHLDVYKPGCADVEMFIRLDVQMSRCLYAQVFGRLYAWM